MQKKTLTLAKILVLASILAFTGSIAIAQDTGPEEMVLKTSTAKKPAKFPHKKHQDNFECSTCHHAKGEDGKQVPFSEGMEIKKCITCHNSDDMTNPKLTNFKVVAHRLCKECHKKNKETAPTKCSGCHIK